MLSDWLFIGIFILLSLLVPGIAIVLAGVLGPRKPNKIKQTAYECGIETVGETWVQFKPQYYIYALVFLVFDVETAFLFPWAVAYGRQTLFMVVEAMVFILILLGGLAYLWRKGALEWH
jgi:NADH:ubiquinone oxidoreductase subunit 3 (subunit A)